MAVIVGTLVLVTHLVLASFERGILPRPVVEFVGEGRTSGLVAFAVAFGVLWLADRLDLMAPTFTPSLGDLATDAAPRADHEPIVPGRG